MGRVAQWTSPTLSPRQYDGRDGGHIQGPGSYANAPVCCAFCEACLDKVELRGTQRLSTDQERRGGRRRKAKDEGRRGRKERTRGREHALREFELAVKILIQCSRT